MDGDACNEVAAAGVPLGVVQTRVLHLLEDVHTVGRDGHELHAAAVVKGNCVRASGGPVHGSRLAVVERSDEADLASRGVVEAEHVLNGALLDGAVHTETGAVEAAGVPRETVDAAGDVQLLDANLLASESEQVNLVGLRLAGGHDAGAVGTLRLPHKAHGLDAENVAHRDLLVLALRAEFLEDNAHGLVGTLHARVRQVVRRGGPREVDVGILLQGDGDHGEGFGVEDKNGVLALLSEESLVVVPLEHGPALVVGAHRKGADKLTETHIPEGALGGARREGVALARGHGELLDFWVVEADHARPLPLDGSPQLRTGGFHRHNVRSHRRPARVVLLHAAAGAVLNSPVGGRCSGGLHVTVRLAGTNNDFTAHRHVWVVPEDLDVVRGAGLHEVLLAAHLVLEPRVRVVDLNGLGDRLHGGLNVLIWGGEVRVEVSPRVGLDAVGAVDGDVVQDRDGTVGLLAGGVLEEREAKAGAGVIVLRKIDVLGGDGAVAEKLVHDTEELRNGGGGGDGQTVDDNARRHVRELGTGVAARKSIGQELATVSHCCWGGRKRGFAKEMCVNKVQKL
eukprot:PhM_4_TR10076/c0_g1_i1/m.46881